MEGVIPNSKVVIIPPLDEDGMWKKELYLRPGEWIPWVTVTVIAATIVLAVIVFVLHLNEKVRLTSRGLYSATPSQSPAYREKMNSKGEEHHITSISMHYEDFCYPTSGM